jgi:hypothetical protein
VLNAEAGRQQVRERERWNREGGGGGREEKQGKDGRERGDSREESGPCAERSVRTCFVLCGGVVMACGDGSVCVSCRVLCCVVV